MAATEQMLASLAVIQAAGAMSLEMDVDDEVAAPEGQATVTPGTSPMDLASPWAVSSCGSPWSPVTPAVNRSSGNVSAFGMARAPNTIGHALVLPIGALNSSSTTMSTPTTSGGCTAQTCLVRVVQVLGSPGAQMNKPRVTFAPSPTSPGAIIRKNAASFGIPLNLRSSAQAAPVPVRSLEGSVVAPSPSACVSGGGCPAAFGNLSAQPAAVRVQPPPQILRSIVTPLSHSRPFRAAGGA
mmetsp:Transcript_170183/g.545768  ORF Transcript_170183/g.545768 Transcript_170183/m.545768 type:complete len:240 (-) Transcript_170183:206-925(-)